MKMKHLMFAVIACAALTMGGQVVAASDGHDHASHEHGSKDHSSHEHGHDMNGGMNHDGHKDMDSGKMDHGDMGDGGHGMSGMSGMFLEKRRIDGYDVSFHVMKAQQGMEHGGSYNFMIKVEKDGKALDDVKINSKVIDPKGKAESKALMKMGDWYMNGYDLGAEGKHQLMILFKTADGQMHKGGVYYPGK